MEDKKSLSQILGELFTEWENQPKPFTAVEFEKEARRRYDAQFILPSSVPVGRAEKNGQKKAEYQLQTITAQELLSQPDEDQPWVVETMIPEEEITTIYGEPGCGKSYIVMYLGICMAAGVPAFTPKTIGSGADVFTGFSVPSAKRVLYVDEENPIRQTRKRLRKMVAGLSDDIQLLFAKSYFIFSQHQGLKIDNPEKFMALKKEVVEKQIEVLIVDTFLSIHSVEENSAKEMGRIHDLLKELSMVTLLQGKRLTIILLTHSPKPGQFSRFEQSTIRGSNVQFGMSGSCILIRKDWLENKRGITVTLVHKKTRAVAPFDSFSAKIEDNEEETSTTVYYEKKINEKITKFLECEDTIVEMIKIHGKSTRKEIIAGMPDFSRATVDRAINNLKERKILLTTRESKTVYYNIKTMEQPSFLES